MPEPQFLQDIDEGSYFLWYCGLHKPQQQLQLQY